MALVTERIEDNVLYLELNGRIDSCAHSGTGCAAGVLLPCSCCGGSSESYSIFEKVCAVNEKRFSERLKRCGNSHQYANNP